MTILDEIISRKKIEVQLSKSRVAEDELSNYVYFDRDCYSLTEFVKNTSKTGIIAEFKRASPSKGIINEISDLKEVVSAYQFSGASAVSVLTDSDFFKGSLKDLSTAREVLQIPLLRKDFIIDPYQITEAKAYGADVILLIAACLTPDQIQNYSEYAKSLGLSVLLEVHDENELNSNLFATIDAIGVNNRNLKDFTVSISTSEHLANKIPDSYTKISESGISDVSAINKLQSAGYDGFLIGENFMRTDNPGLAMAEFVEKLR